jgi:WXG100 family type VII secretion target
MSNQIEVSYGDMQQILSQLNEAASNSQQLMQRLKNQIEVLQGGAWIGDNADKFYQVMDNDVMLGVQRLVNGLNEAIGVTQQIVSNYESAEEQAQAVFPAS